MGSVPSPALLEWPQAWQDAALLPILEDSPFRVLAFAGNVPPEVSAAASSRFTLLERPGWSKLAEVDWRNPPDPLFIGDAVWPSLGAAGGTDSAEAGPTGLPWLDSNGWLIRMARCLARSSRIWIRSEPPQDAAATDASLFAFAQLEARAHGAARLLSLQPAIAAGLAAGNSSALAWWRRVCAAESWWQTRASWHDWPTCARLAVVSDFAGPNLYPATEFLNLAARRNLPWQAVHAARLEEKSLRGMVATLYIDQQPLAGPLLAPLQAFAESGGLLVCLASARGGIRNLDPRPAVHPRFDIHRCGKGRVALSRGDWEDPYVLAQDVHLLMSRRNDVIRLFNPGSILAWPIQSPDRRRLLVHLLNYSRYGAAHDVAVQTWQPVKAAWMERPGANRRPVELRREAGGWEAVLEPFDAYCALEMEVRPDGP
ncbi:MAG: hypothetical protein WHT08_16280 [Bryobacteraceae bacterium]|jgi:hypothetical protein